MNSVERHGIVARWQEISYQKATAIAKAAGIGKLPRIGYEKRLDDSRVLVNYAGSYEIQYR